MNILVTCLTILEWKVLRRVQSRKSLDKIEFLRSMQPSRDHSKFIIGGRMLIYKSNRYIYYDLHSDIIDFYIIVFICRPIY